MKKLDFEILPDDGILEARVKGGFYHIYQSNGFFVSFCYLGESVKIGDFLNIYDALDASNKHYNGVE